MRHTIVSLFITLGILTTIPASATGLKFFGSTVSIEKKTSLRPFNGRSKAVKDSLVIEFDAKFDPLSYGYIFTLKFKGGEGPGSVIKLLYDNASDINKATLSTVLEGKRVITSDSVPFEEISDKWLHVRTKMDLVTDSLSISLNDRQVVEGGASFTPKMKTSISFGWYEAQPDVPSMSINNLTVSLGKDIYRYDLDEDSGNYAYCKGKPFAKAVVQNPYWLKTNFKEWRNVFVNKSDVFQVFGYNTYTSQFYSLTDTERIVADTYGNVIKLTGNNPIPTSMGTSVADPSNGDIYVYEFYNKRGLHDDDPSLAVLKNDSAEWKVLAKGYLGYPKIRNAIVVDTLSNRLVGYGGYGMFRYDGKLYTYTKGDDKWVEMPPVTGDELVPRSMHAMAIDGHTLYIFGGVGSSSGEQILSKHLYTLHSIDLETNVCSKLWEIEWDGGEEIPTENMILDGEGNFYVLMYAVFSANASLKLHKFSLEDGSHVAYGNAIPMLTDRLTCQANLFYDKRLSLLIATKTEDTVKSETTASAYVLAFPPMDKSISTVELRKRRMIALASALSVFVVILILLLCWISKNYRVKHHGSHKLITPPDEVADSIYLFGDFTALSGSGEIITMDFYAKLRQMMCLLISSSQKNGISTQRLTEILWPDRDEYNAKNIRGVTMNHLRKALSKLPGAKVDYSDGRYRFTAETPLYCDYIEFTSQMASATPDMDRVLAILSRGRFLSSESDPVTEPIKENVERVIVPTVQLEMEKRFNLKQYQNVLLCVKILTEIDPVDEDAMKYCVRSLIALGRDEDSRQRYNDFRKKYSAYYGEAYTTEYEAIMR